MCGSITIFIYSEKKVEQGLSAIQVLCLTLKNFLNKLWATEKKSCRGEEKKKIFNSCSRRLPKPTPNFRFCMICNFEGYKMTEYCLNVQYFAKKQYCKSTYIFVTSVVDKYIYQKSHFNCKITFKKCNWW